MATLFVLNTFRSCAKEKNLVVELPIQYQFSSQEQSLVTYLMERNPFVCRFENRSHNKSLEIIN
ncbi:hypothetical protein Ltuc_2221 [Legionella tucsonensis]|uniref:Uncharacterized protein n=1 Tax=Legionella tucsonensis TaxID=40335 RepID=A0A0W0ZZ98_9GAMM|nr:hypothetical protein Ltuc_2221 [Legionella tucsonensis]